jgi:hypothetical protein
MAGPNDKLDPDLEDLFDGEEGEGQDAPDEGEDAGDGDDEADEGEGQEEIDAADGEEDEGEVAPPPRAKNRVHSLAQRVKAERERNDRLEARLKELEGRGPAPAQQSRQETPEEEEQRLLLMTAEERMAYRLEKFERTQRERDARDMFSRADMSDKAEFVAKTATDPVARKLAEKVETRLAELRKDGMNVKRDVLLTYLVGEMVRAGGLKAVRSQRKSGAASVARQSARPSNGAGDVSAQRSRGAKSAADRLNGVLI